MHESSLHCEFLLQYLSQVSSSGVTHHALGTRSWWCGSSKLGFRCWCAEVICWILDTSLWRSSLLRSREAIEGKMLASSVGILTSRHTLTLFLSTTLSWGRSVKLSREQSLA